MKSNLPKLSFEFFPARSEKGADSLMQVYSALNVFKPEFFSVTFGAGGSTQRGTYDAIKLLLERGADAAPHISCVGAIESDITEMVDAYLAIGVKRLVVLRGDLPSGMVGRGDFDYANELVAFIRAQYGADLHLEVAAYPDFHPESSTPSKDIENFKRKMDAGANSAITQYFYNADSYFAFVEQAESMGVRVPIVPGIMPITNYASLVRFSNNCGAELPMWIRRRLEEYQDDKVSLLAFGKEVVTQLCEKLIENHVPGMHFYCLNKANPVHDICVELGYSASE